MSDKVEKHLRNLNIHASTSRAVRFPTKTGNEYTLHELMQSYADQEKKAYLKEVLGEAEKTLKERYPIILHELVVRKELNHLKQTKG